MVSTPAGVLDLGMAGRAAAPLAEVFDLFERQRRLVEHFAVGVDFAHAGQVDQRVEQHRGVAAGEDEAIAVRPERRGRVVAQVLRPQLIGDRRQGHRRAGMAAVGRLDGVHRQRADGVDRGLFEAFGDGGHSVNCRAAAIK